MIVTISPSVIKGSIRAAASKSSMQRACAAALLVKGDTTIVNPGKSNDDLAALDVIQKLGATITQDANGNILVHSGGVNPLDAEINCGESGLGIRMFTPIASLSEKPVTISGTGSLLSRPMHFFDEILPELGVTIRSNGGHLPLMIQGPLKPSDITVDGSLSSQFLTGLLMAYGAAGADDGVIITVKELKSKPYIDLTLQVMRHFGWEVEHTNYEQFHFKQVKQQSAVHRYAVEGDWSGAAFLLVAGAIAGNITVRGLDVYSAQADNNLSMK